MQASVLYGHVCTICEELLLISNNNVEYKDYKLFTLMKTYVDSSLVHVTENIFQIIMIWEKQFKCVIQNIIHKKNLGKLIKDILTHNCPIIQLCCPESPDFFMHVYKNKMPLGSTYDKTKNGNKNK